MSLGYPESVFFFQVPSSLTPCFAQIKPLDSVSFLPLFQSGKFIQQDSMPISQLLERDLGLWTE